MCRPAPPGVGQELERGAAVAEAVGLAEEQRRVAGVGDLGAVVEEDPDDLAVCLTDRQGYGLRRGLRQDELGALHRAGLVEADRHFGPGPLLAR